MKANAKKLLIPFVLCFSLLVCAFFSVAYAENSDPNDDNDNEQPQISVVFVKDGGSDDNDGLTQKAAFATLHKAFSALSETGGKIIVCGKLTIDDNNTTIPSHEKDIEITSLHEGVDYRSKGKAEIIYKETINIYGPGKTVLNGIKLHSERSANIYCNGSNVEFGNRIENVSDDNTYPSIYGGRLLSALNSTSDGAFSNYTIDINGGYWHHVTLGNLRTDINSPMSEIKNATLNINGGTFVSTDLDEYTCSLISGAVVGETLTLNISAGIFYGSFYVIGNEGPLSHYVNQRYNADISVNITNGSFLGNYIKALYNKNSSLHGKYDFKVLDGSFSSLIYVGCENVYGDINLQSCDSVQNKLYGFEKVVFVSADGNDDNSGENEGSPKKTLSGAITSLTNGGTVVVCSEMKLPDGFIMTSNDNVIKITSKYHEKDYAQTNNAKITAEGNINLGTDIIFENIKIASPSTATFVCTAESTTFDTGVVTEGDVGITLAKREDLHTLKIISGNFSVVDLKPSEKLTSLIINGGSIELLRGSDETHNGDLYLELSGGEIKNTIDLSSQSASGNVQLIVGNVLLGGQIIAPKTAEGMVCEVLVANPEFKSSISGFEFVGDRYIFVKDNGTGDGSTPSLALPTIDDALSKLSGQSASIIICGKYTHNSKNTSVTSGINTYTSKYRNLDFSVIENASMTLNSDLNFHNDATIKDITIITNKPDISFRCNSHIVLFGYGINCKPLFHTLNYYPSIYAAESNPLSPYNEKGESLSDKITIMGGTWNNVYASAATHINGSVIKGSLFGTKNLTNDCAITISNGEIYGGIYAAEQIAQNSKYNISITFTGGEIHGIISPSKEASSGYQGKYIINVIDVDFSGVEKIYDANFVGGEKSYAYIANSYDSSIYEKRFIKYQNPISTKNSSLYYLDGYWYLFEAEDGNINVYRNISLQSIHTGTPYTVIETGGDIHDFTVSLTNSKFYVFAKNVFNSNVRTRVYTSDKSNNSLSFSFIKDIDDASISSPSLFWLNSEMYMYFSKTSEEGTTSIFCAKLKDDLSFGTDPIKILSADQKWEEGIVSTPRVLSAADGNIFLCYTGGNTAKGSSMIGISLLINRKDLLNEASYMKDKDPAFYENDEYTNLVLSSFLCIKENEPYIIYSTRKDNESMLIMQSFSYDEIGKPFFDSHIDLGMQYLAYCTSKEFSGLLSGFKINYKEEIPPQSLIKQPLTLSILSTEQIIFICGGLLILLLILAIFLIKKFMHSPKSKKTGIDRSKRKSGKMYVEYLNSKPNGTESESNEEYIHTEIIYQEDESDKIDEEARQLELQNAILDIFGVASNFASGTNNQSKLNDQDTDELLTSDEPSEKAQDISVEILNEDIVNAPTSEADFGETVDTNEIISEKSKINESKATQDTDNKTENAPNKIRKRPRPKRNI